MGISEKSFRLLVDLPRWVFQPKFHSIICRASTYLIILVAKLSHKLLRVNEAEIGISGMVSIIENGKKLFKRAFYDVDLDGYTQNP
ncbi:MAG: hypothetical protein GY927_20555 [bacterium]|nr:hypothetical protein [bacterium]